MKKLLIVIILGLTPCVFGQQPADPNPVFWNSLQSMCNKAYAGRVVKAPSGDTTFEGKKIVMHVYSCLPKKIKINVAVGEDRTRNWIFYQYEDRFLLKHDHRKKNGFPDGVTDYGGWTTNSGTATRQVFPADQETFTKIPEAFSNVWSVDLIAGDRFIYNLVRIGSNREYSLEFDLKKTVPYLLEN